MFYFPSTCSNKKKQNLYFSRKNEKGSWLAAVEISFVFLAFGAGMTLSLDFGICPDNIEACYAWTISASLLLLMFAFLVANVFHSFHLHFIPESCVFMVLGLLFSGLFLLFFTHDQLNAFMSLNEPTFILILLPPIIFEGGYNLKKIYFFRNFGLIMSLAIIGTAISAFIIGGFLYVFSNYTSMKPDNISAAEAMSIGSLLSATDPVAALAVYSTLGVDRTLFTLVYGESNLNDAIGIVFFRTFRGLYAATGEFTDPDAIPPGWDAILQFFCVTFVAPLIGIVTGLVSALIFKYARFNEIPIVETVMFWSFSYLSYMLGEAPGFSGIISTLFCGFVMRHYAYHNLSDKGKDLSIDVIKFVATTADTIIFINLGFSPFAFKSDTTWSFPLISLTIVLCLVSRAITVFGLCFIANLVRKRRKDVAPVNFKTQAVLYHAGLRGAVAFVLALEFLDDGGEDYWLATTIAVIFFTVFVLGGTTALLVRILGVKSEGEKMHVTEVSSAYAEVFSDWERRWIAPIFVNVDHLDELVVDDGGENQEDEIRDFLLAKFQAAPAFESHFHDGYHTELDVRKRIATHKDALLHVNNAVNDAGYQTQ